MQGKFRGGAKGVGLFTIRETMQKKPYNYTQADMRHISHHARRNEFIGRMPHKLTCQLCGGSGGELEVVTDDGQGPWFNCGLCEGTGLNTPYERADYLRILRREKRELTGTA